MFVKIVIHVQESLSGSIEKLAKEKNMTTEQYITEVLNKYVIDPHIMQVKSVAVGYEECGDINLEIANL